jgi:hypothetical protein
MKRTIRNPRHAPQSRLYICYTYCDNGVRVFTPVEGVCISYDRKFIDIIIKERKGNTEVLKAHHDMQEIVVSDMKAQMAVPSIVDVALHKNRETVSEQISNTKRLATAEAVVNGELVRNVMYFQDIKKAIAYSEGA